MSANKVVIVTGASRGIGLAIAHFLLKRKTNLVVIARSQAPLDQLREQYPGQVEVLAGDLADTSLGRKARDLAVNQWQRLDGLIVNHGVLEPVQRIADVDIDEWRRCFDINSVSAVSMVQACLPSLRDSKGRIVFCSSGAAVSARSGWGAYGATKAVLNHLATTLAVEEPDVVSVSIRPGVVDTGMQKALRESYHDSMDAKDVASFTEMKNTGKLVQPEQPGHVMANLALDASKDLSGKFLSWNDGQLASYQS